MRLSSSTRNAQIATIKIAIKNLGMDDATYRTMLANTCGGKTSAADLSAVERTRVIDHLVTKGAVIQRSSKRKGAPTTLSRNEQLGKIEAQLADMGLPWAYADKVAENITGGKAGGIQRLGWVRETKHLSKVIAALAYEQKKRGLLADVDELLKRAGKTRADLETRLQPEFRKNWTRRIATLEALVKQVQGWDW